MTGAWRAEGTEYFTRYVTRFIGSGAYTGSPGLSTVVTTVEPQSRSLVTVERAVTVHWDVARWFPIPTTDAIPDASEDTGLTWYAPGPWLTLRRGSLELRYGGVRGSVTALPGDVLEVAYDGVTDEESGLEWPGQGASGRVYLPEVALYLTSDLRATPEASGAVADVLPPTLSTARLPVPVGARSYSSHLSGGATSFWYIYGHVFLVGPASGLIPGRATAVIVPIGGQSVALFG